MFFSTDFKFHQDYGRMIKKGCVTELCFRLTGFPPGKSNLGLTDIEARPKPTELPGHKGSSKFWDRQVWANSVDPEQEQTNQNLHYLPFHLHLQVTLLHCKTKHFCCMTITAIISGVPFLARLNKVQEELLYYPWRWHWRRHFHRGRR